MALIACPNCENTIDSKAQECPHCGIQKKPKSRPKNHIICPNPNCGYEGKVARKARGSLLTGLILCCLFLLPGLIYFMFMSGYRYYCPNCKMQIAQDN